VRRDLAIALVLFGVALWANLAQVTTTSFHRDEARWIHRARFVAHLSDPLGDYWHDRDLMRGQPPLGSYLMGVGLLAQGRDTTTNGLWNFSKGELWNQWQGRMPTREDLIAARRTDSVVGALIAVVAFGLVLAIFHQGDVAPGVRPPTATEWSVINVAVGVASGVLFHLFLGPRGHLDEGRLFVALAGAIVVASGASYYLNLSPIFTNLVLGFILVNSGSAHRDVTRLLLSTERPVYLALLLFAGAAWSPGSVDLLFIAPLFVMIRVFARFLGGGMAGGYVAPPELRAPGLGRGLLALGGIGVALALNYGQVYPELHPRLILTATLLAVLLFEIVASREASAFILSLGAPPEAAEPEPEPAAAADA